MKIERQDNDALTATISITIEKEDYKEKFKSELNKYRNKAHLKGFRKGRTPAGVIKRMYGKSLFAELIDDILNKSLSEYIQSEKLNLLGQPLPGEQMDVDLQIDGDKEYTFNYDIGLAPDPEIKGLEKNYQRSLAEILDAEVEEEWEHMLKHNMDTIWPEDGIAERDILVLHAEEIDLDKPTDQLHKSDVYVLVDDLTDDLKDQVLKLKKGDTFKFDPFEFEKDKDESYVRKYILKLKDEDTQEVASEYEALIDNVMRKVDPELNQEFFDKIFGVGNVSNLEEAKLKVRSYIEDQYKVYSNSLLFDELKKQIIEASVIDLPDAFLKRWLNLTNENLNEQEIDNDYPAFVEGLKWSLIRSKLIKENEIQVNDEELVNGMKNQLAQIPQFRQMDPQTQQMILENSMKNQERVNEVYENILSNKLFEVLEEQIEIEDQYIPKETLVAEYNELMGHKHSHEEE